jgi:oligopeptide transport system permease protein
MIAFVLRRLLSAIPTLWVIVTFAFFLMHSVPGGPFDSERTLPPEVEANLEAAYNLDKPVIVQYGLYLADIVRGDLGPSFKYSDFTVAEVIASGLPVSAQLGLTAMSIALVVGVLLGTVAAIRQNSITDYSVMTIAMTGIAIPNFVMAPLLSLVLGVYLGLLPVAGWNGGALPNLVLPVTAMALPYVAYIARLMRGSMIEILRSNYIRTARAKGLRESVVILRHAMPAAILPVVSFLGPATAGILTGSVVIEQIFSLPGIGKFFVQGALNRDYTLVMGVIIFYSSAIIVFNIIVDLVYRVLDPRVRQA